MSSMIPERGDDRVYIPTTIDLIPGSKALTTQKWLISAALLLVWIFLSVCFVIANEEMHMKILLPIGSFIVATTIIRFVVIKERFFRLKQRELMACNYTFEIGAFWNIYEITSSYPTIAMYSNGVKAIFVEMKKGVIIGKDETSDFDHHDAISAAYQQMAKRNISCLHIDHMDVVGRDDRLNGLFETVSQANNDDLRKILTIFLDNVQTEMNQAYADYDVYVFFFRGREDIFWEELQVVLRAFRNANYVADKILNKQDIRELVLSVMNVRDFSVNAACDQVFSRTGIRKYIKVISTTNNGVRVQRNKTSSQIMQENQILTAEKDIRKEKRTKIGNLFGGKRRREQHVNIFEESTQSTQTPTVKKKKINTDEDVDLFGDSDKQ